MSCWMNTELNVETRINQGSACVCVCMFEVGEKSKQIRIRMECCINHLVHWILPKGWTQAWTQACWFNFSHLLKWKEIGLHNISLFFSYAVHSSILLIVWLYQSYTNFNFEQYYWCNCHASKNSRDVSHSQVLLCCDICNCLFFLPHFLHNV